MGAFTPDLSLYTDIFQNTKFFGEGWIIGLVLVLLCMIIVSRNLQHWGYLFLPMFSIIHILGIKTTNSIFYSGIILGSLWFVVTGLSTEAIANFVTTMGRDIMSNTIEKKEELKARVKSEKAKYGTVLSDQTRSDIKNINLGKLKMKMEDSEKRISEREIERQRESKDKQEDRFLREIMSKTPTMLEEDRVEADKYNKYLNKRETKLKMKWNENKILSKVGKWRLQNMPEEKYKINDILEENGLTFGDVLKYNNSGEDRITVYDIFKNPDEYIGKIKVFKDKITKGITGK